MPPRKYQISSLSWLNWVLLLYNTHFILGLDFPSYRSDLFRSAPIFWQYWIYIEPHFLKPAPNHKSPNSTNSSNTLLMRHMTPHGVCSALLQGVIINPTGLITGAFLVFSDFRALTQYVRITSIWKFIPSFWKVLPISGGQEYISFLKLISN